MLITGKRITELAGGRSQGPIAEMLPAVREAARGTELLARIEAALSDSAQLVTGLWVRWDGEITTCEVDEILRDVDTRATSSEPAKLIEPGTWTLILQ